MKKKKFHFFFFFLLLLVKKKKKKGENHEFCCIEKTKQKSNELAHGNNARERRKKKESDGSLKYTTQNGVEFSTLVGCRLLSSPPIARFHIFKKRKKKNWRRVGWGRSRVPVLYIIAVFNQLAHAHTHRVNEKVPSL